MICKRQMVASARMLLRSTRGLTVLELLFVLVIFGIVSSAIYGLLKTGVTSAGFNAGSLQAQVQIRSALDNMVDEARWADSATVAQANTVTLHVPQNTPFSVGPYTVTFTYNAGTGTVTRLVTGPAVALAYNVVGFSLSYYNAAGVSLGSAPADLTQVAMVQFNVSTATATAGTGRTLAGNAALRAH